MNTIIGENINQVVYKSLQKITKEGFRTPSRNGDVLALYDTEIILNDPSSIHLNLIGRTNNIFATIGEMFWVMAGEEKIDPYLSFFIPRAKNYSDDGETWSAAYGERMFAKNQVQNLLEHFKRDSLFTRRATLSIYDPSRDTYDAYLEKGIEMPKDIPCNQWMNFFVTPDKKLNMKVQQRSGDIIFGTGNINLPEFSMFQRFIVQMLQQEVDKDVSLGYYHHSVTNLHLYDFNGKQGYDILKNEHDQVLGRINSDDMEFPKSIETTQDFFSNLVELFSSHIVAEDGVPLGEDYKELISGISVLFESYDVQTDGNILYAYSRCIAAFIYQKKGLKDITLDLSSYSDEFSEAIKNNHFNKGINII